MTAERWRRIQEVFHSASDCPPGERHRFLIIQTGGDEELIREVEKMLRHASGAGLLDQPAWNGGMPLDEPIASHLGPYEILEEAGAGGMSRVYKARDTRLGRIVAIKVLSAEFSHRFTLEARAISALNHPHVCSLYDIGEQDESAYLVMEYVEGKSLAAILESGPLPLDEVLLYGSQIADALATAHALGIVHRDLKPANIMITHAGAKVLDFGLAQMMAEDSEPAPGPGAVMGTLAYMSPSRLNGNPSDTRSDIYALGLVLYEMASGRRAFSGKDRPTDLPRLKNVPSGLADLVSRCLREQAASRVQRMEEIRFTLDRLRFNAPPARSRRVQVAWLVAALAVLAAAGVVLWKNHFEPIPQLTAPQPIISLTVPAATPQRSWDSQAPPPKPVIPPSLEALTNYPGLERDPSFSPDGKNIAFSWHGLHAPSWGIFVRPVSIDAAVQALTDGVNQDYGPVWSPDGRTIAFRRGGNPPGIYVVPVAGGPATMLAPIARQDGETLPQMSWSPDGKWIAAPDRSTKGGTEIHLFSTKSGEARTITSNVTGIDHAPAFSPNGKSLAYASCANGSRSCDVYVVDLASGYIPKTVHRITTQNSYIRGVSWVPDGRSLVYAASLKGQKSGDETSLWHAYLNPAQPPERFDLAGTLVRHPVVSPAGGLLAFTKFTSGSWDLMLIRNFR